MEQSPARPDTAAPGGIALTEAEIADGKLSGEHRKLAVAALSFRGYVILCGALPGGFLQTLGREWTEIYQDCRAALDLVETDASPDALHRLRISSRKRAAFWFRKSRWRVFPRLTGPMADPLLHANPFVVPILADLLGPDYYCKYVSSDTCLKGAILQSPHTDIDQDRLFEEGEWRPRGYIVNVPLVECGLHNGPIEVWPGGSHLWSAAMFKRFDLEPHVQDGRNPPVEALARQFHSVKLTMSPGDILIRDLAMWHRGTPSESDEPRTMLTTAYFRAGYAYGYGGLENSLDAGLFAGLAPAVQKRFRHHFSIASRLRRGHQRIRTAIRPWLGR